jgi:hypothetical protein
MSEEDASTERVHIANTGEVVYLYCFARSALLQVVEAKGVDGRDPPVLRRFDDVSAVVSLIPSDEFCGPAAKTRLEDLSWIGPRACRHEAVVEEVMRHSPVFPVRFGTIFSSLERLDCVLERHRDSISAFLNRVAEKEEWAVKAFVNRATATEGLFQMSLAGHGERLAASSPGVRYLEERRIRTDVEKELKGRLSKACKEVAEGLSNCASDWRERKVLPVEAEGCDMVVNWAFLVPESAMTEFRAQIDRANARYARQGLRFQGSGPWPPYSFFPCLDAETEG